MNSDKLREWIQTLGLVSIPVVVAFAGNAVAKSNATRESDARMIEIAAQVLAGPVNDSTRPLREWAAKELARHSDVPFSAGAESILVRIGDPGLFALVAGRQLRGFLMCDSVGNKCRPMIAQRPLPVQDVPDVFVRLLISPKSVTIGPTQAMDFVAFALTAAGDTTRIPDLTWTASGGSISDTSTRGGRHYARFVAPTATGTYIVTAHAASARLADTARVTVQAR